MIEVQLAVWIVAADDAAADRMIAKLHPPYDPKVLNVQIIETERKVS